VPFYATPCETLCAIHGFGCDSVRSRLVYPCASNMNTYIDTHTETGTDTDTSTDTDTDNEKHTCTHTCRHTHTLLLLLGSSWYTMSHDSHSVHSPQLGPLRSVIAECLRTVWGSNLYQLCCLKKFKTPHPSGHRRPHAHTHTLVQRGLPDDRSASRFGAIVFVHKWTGGNHGSRQGAPGVPQALAVC
jgi:hypothetical protein